MRVDSPAVSPNKSRVRYPFVFANGSSASRAAICAGVALLLYLPYLGGVDITGDDEARDVLLKEQRTDGSWSQLPDRDGDAYATGAVLMALRRAGVEPGTAPYRKGVDYLVNTQRTDGAWIVETRSRPIQRPNHRLRRASAPPTS